MIKCYAIAEATEISLSEDGKNSLQLATQDGKVEVTENLDITNKMMSEIREKIEKGERVVVIGGESDKINVFYQFSVSKLIETMGEQDDK